MRKGGKVVGSALPLWILSAAGLGALYWHRPARGRALFVLLLCLFSFLAVCPGFYFRYHYFVYVLPAAGLLAGLAATSLARMPLVAERRWLRGAIPVVLIVAGSAWPLHVQRGYLFTLTPDQVARMTFGHNPFVESPAIAGYIRRNTSPGQTIAVIGSEPQIYFYARRRAATGYIYTYPLMDPRDFSLAMQEEMIDEIQRADPAILVYVGVPSSWLQKRDSNTRILEWFERYSRERYDLTGLVEITPFRTDYRWGRTATWPPRTDHWLAILKRRGAS
jgi:hypothetical protein